MRRFTRGDVVRFRCENEADPVPGVVIGQTSTKILMWRVRTQESEAGQKLILHEVDANSLLSAPALMYNTQVKELAAFEKEMFEQRQLLAVEIVANREKYRGIVERVDEANQVAE